jgi:RimJ/RimL family protein N-acetyltransferase
VLRPWRDDDVDALTAMSRDPEVMACFPALASRDDCAAVIARQQAHFARHGFGLWVIEPKDAPGFAGFTGIQHVPFDAPFTPAIELGWRLARAHWGKGYATEAARAAVALAFETLQLAGLVAFMIPANARSAAVATKLGMSRDPAGDFDHPRIASGARSVAGHPMQRHVLYRLRSDRVDLGRR